jgi:hypothetical protein
MFSSYQFFFFFHFINLESEFCTLVQMLTRKLWMCIHMLWSDVTFEKRKLPCTRALFAVWMGALMRIKTKKKKKNPWSESASELYRPSDHRLSAKWLTTFAGRGCHVVSVTDPYGRTLGFLDRSRYYQVAPQFVLARLSGPRSRPTTVFFLFFFFLQKIW